MTAGLQKKKQKHSGITDIKINPHLLDILRRILGAKGTCKGFTAGSLMKTNNVSLARITSHGGCSRSSPTHVLFSLTLRLFIFYLCFL